MNPKCQRNRIVIAKIWLIVAAKWVWKPQVSQYAVLLVSPNPSYMVLGTKKVLFHQEYPET